MRQTGRKSPSVNRYSVQQPSPNSTLRNSADFRRSMISNSSATPGGGNFGVNLDPKVDKRAAVKPSLVKKKKNTTGIRFSMNYMLAKKAQKINKK